MKKFFAVLIVFLISFSLAFVTMTIAAEKDNAQGAWSVAYPEGTLFLAWWAFLGDYGDSFAHFHQTYFGVALLGAYVVLSQILLANLLIAIMTDSYSDIRENSDIEWKFNRFAFLDQYSTTHILPPPFNILSQFLSWILGMIQQETEERVHRLNDIALVRLRQKREQVIAERARKEEKKSKNRLKKISSKLETLADGQRNMDIHEKLDALLRGQQLFEMRLEKIESERKEKGKQEE